MRKILFLLTLVLSLGATAQINTGSNCIMIMDSRTTNPLQKVRDGFTRDNLDALGLTLVSVGEQQRGNETVVTCKAKSEEGPVTFHARVSGGGVLLFGFYTQDGKNKRMYYSGNESDMASFYFLKLAGMPAEQMFFDARTVRYATKADPWVD